MNKKLTSFLILFIILVLSQRYYITYCQSQYEDIKYNIETRLVIEYNLVKMLDQENIDVTYYVNVLNLIMDTLSYAEKYYLIGDEQNANSKLNLAISLLDNIDNDLKATLIDYYSKEMWINFSKFSTPIIATFFVMFFTIIFWIVYKQYYYNKLLKMKPEVNEFEN